MLKHIVALALILSFAACAQQPEERPPLRLLEEDERYGSLDVTTDPEGAIISIGEDAAGRAPIHLDRLPIGWHDVTADFGDHQQTERKFVYAGENELHIQRE